MQYKLNATTQKSYYGKATVIEENGEKMLKSYNTIVCKIDANGNFVKCWNGYSRTTQNHINDFRRLNGLDPMNKREWMNAKSENDNGERYKVEYGNGFWKSKTEATFDNYEDAEAFAESIEERNYSLWSCVVEA